MDYSFYGGRPGQSMVIVKYFSSIAEMATEFKKGDSYTEVGYGECVLIDTKDPRNLENGRLYKRGLDNSNIETGGAEYLGTIKGPAGYSPHMTIADFDSIPTEEADGIKYLMSNGSFSIQNAGLVSGKEYNEIEWRTMSFRELVYRDEKGNRINIPVDATVEIKGQELIITKKDGIKETKKFTTAEEETIVQIGFKIPYHVLEYSAYTISAYAHDYRDSSSNLNWGHNDNRNNVNKDIKYSGLASQTNINTDNPFYSTWDIKIPEGIKGDGVKGLKIIPIREYKQIRNSEQNNDSDIVYHNEWDSDFNQLSDSDDRLIVVYEYYDYHKSPQGTKITKYLGEYNTIKEISVDEFGTLTVHYTYNEEKVLPYVIKNIVNISLDQNGVVSFYYNVPAGDTDEERKQNENPFKPLTIQQSNNLKWIERTELTDNYHLMVYNNQGESADLGSIKVDSTLSIAFNIKPSDTVVTPELGTITAGTTVESNILYLNNKYPQGLTENASGQPVNAAWMKGKIVTIGPVDLDKSEQRKNFYAFDYNENTWYYLGNLSGLGVQKFQQIVERDDESISNAMAQLEVGGVCLIISQRPTPIAETENLDSVLEEQYHDN